MDRYKKLLGNTMLFGLATFSSKILTFLMLPVITRLVTPEDYSTMDLVANSSLFIVPIISLCVHEAVIRFGLDKSERKSDVFTTAILTIFTGYMFLWLCWPAVGLVTRIRDYRGLIYVYVLTSALRSTVTHFVRASGFTRLFALDGIVTTVSTVLYTILFLGPLKLGVSGYVFATILADAISAAGLVLLLRLHRFFRPRELRRGTLRAMLRYSAPLVPTALFWWITNLSDHYLVDAITGEAANGLYVISYKIPTMITLVSTIFIQAWQVSAFSEEDPKERDRFFSTVLGGYQTLIFLAASGLILLIRPITKILVAPEYYESWRHVPFLVLALSFSCLVTFLGTIYNVAKHNRMVGITTGVGAAVNLGLNLCLIPVYGANGAAFATFISYFVVFVIRAVDTRRYMDVKLHPLRIGASLGILLVQVWAGMGEVQYWIGIEIAAFLLLLAVNVAPILYILRALRSRLPRER